MEKVIPNHIKSLRNWQIRVLPHVFQPKNLFISAQTGQGKSLVIDLCILYALQNDSPVLLIEPFIATAEQRYNEMVKLKPEKFYGQNIGSIDFQVAVAVPERSLGILDYVEDLTIIFDEGQFVAEGGYRGGIFEFLLIRAIEVAKRVIVLSATAPVQVFSSLLGGDNFVSSERENVLRYQLVEGYNRLLIQEKQQIQVVSVKNVLDMVQNVLKGHRIEFNRLQIGQLEKYQVLPLIKFLSLKKEKYLIFCRSRVQCEYYALFLAMQIGFSSQKSQSQISQTVKDQNQIICQRLAFCLQQNIGFHHAELGGELRHIVEQEYIHNNIQFLFCTTTLSTGVNLPIDHVVILMYDQLQYSDIQLIQMAGRAGRFNNSAGTCTIFLDLSSKKQKLDTKTKNIYLDQIHRLETRKFDFISSIAQNKQIQTYLVTQSFLKQQYQTLQTLQTHFDKYLQINTILNKKFNVKEIVEYSLQQGIIKQQDGVYQLTQIGGAIFNSGIQVTYLNSSIEELQIILKQLNLMSPIQLLYIITADNVHDFMISEITLEFLQNFISIDTNQVMMSNLLKINPEQNALLEEISSYMIYERVKIISRKQLLRLISSMAILIYIYEKNLEDASRTLDLPQEVILQITESALQYCKKIIEVCHSLRWTLLAELFKKIDQDLQFGKDNQSQDILQKVPDLTLKECQLLNKAGILTPDDLKQKFQSPQQIYDFLIQNLPFHSLKLIDNDINGTSFIRYTTIFNQIQNLPDLQIICFIEPINISNQQKSQYLALIFDENQLTYFTMNQNNTIYQITMDLIIANKSKFYFTTEAQNINQSQSKQLSSIEYLFWCFNPHYTNYDLSQIINVFGILQSPEYVRLLQSFDTNEIVSLNQFQALLQVNLLIQVIFTNSNKYQKQLFFSIDQPIYSLIQNCQNSQIIINQTLLQSQIQILTNYIDLVQIYCQSINQATINIESNKQVYDLLFNVLKIPCFNKKKSTAKDTIITFINIHPCIKYILSARSAIQILSNLKQFTQNTLPYKITLNSTETGRVTYQHLPLQYLARPISLCLGIEIPHQNLKNTNLAQLPYTTIFNTNNVSGSSLALQISPRHILQPAKNKKFLIMDFKQFELRVLAHFLEDENFTQKISEGDIFTEISQNLKIPRPQVKQAIYGIIYGGTTAQIQHQSNLTETQTSEILKTFQLFTPNFEVFHSKLSHFILEHHKINTIFGRFRQINSSFQSNKNQQNKAIRQAISTICQGSAAEICKLAMLRIQESFPELKLILQLHDELIYEISDGFDVAEVVRAAEVDGVGLRVKLEVKWRVSEVW